MSSGDGKNHGTMADPSQPLPQSQPQPQQYQYQYLYQYGTFGVPDYSQPTIGFPQPIVSSGAVAAPSAPAYPPLPYPSAPQYYAQGYQAVPAGYVAVAEGRPLRLRRLPCCGFGLGWFLFILGFFLAAIPWYIGVFALLCVRVDYREKPGFIACSIAAVLFAIAAFLGLRKDTDAW